MSHRHGVAFGRHVLRGPLTASLLLLVAVPMVILIAYSFWQVRAFQVTRDLTLANYRNIWQRDVYRRGLLNTVHISFLTALVTTSLAFALAWAVRFYIHKRRDLVVVVIVVSSVASYLARLYSWRGVLGSNGFINYSLIQIGLIDQPLDFLIFNRFAVTVALTHLFLPYAFLPIYANLLTIDPETIEAGRVLGAGPVRNFLHVGLPLSSTGIMVSFTYVMVFAAGDFATAMFLGGPQGVVATVLINSQFTSVFDWPLGAALSVVYLLILGLIVLVLASITAKQARRVGQR